MKTSGPAVQPISAAAGLGTNGANHPHPRTLSPPTDKTPREVIEMTVHDSSAAMDRPAERPVTQMDLGADAGDCGWVRYANCQDADPDLFTPFSVRAKDIPHALDYCWKIRGGCPVRDYCGRWADAQREPGVWGGRLRYLSAGRYVIAPECKADGCVAPVLLRGDGYCSARCAKPSAQRPAGRFAVPAA
jgi:hypothetical protein